MRGPGFCGHRISLVMLLREHKESSWYRKWCLLSVVFSIFWSVTTNSSYKHSLLGLGNSSREVIVEGKNGLPMIIDPCLPHTSWVELSLCVGTGIAWLMDKVKQCD